ncbi:hypothetical protein C9374_008003 [Naegleria lovaniensis]|uniref:NAD-dependent epimerase/dehydratase domain-containing protein n=1 Tax=Naegleria lovaniensis TaxID=51637 RepID=A0AA88GKP1_NAELO|nr:uncharacterized protein C9374_008003 [Naegleria lovaniensis]KAG2378855.1 hypothetical protein C9374_008003 [Naegleria lovaniensis]
MSSKVLILGANGYIGLGVAKAFSRNGFKVYGSVRSDKHVTTLQQNEIIPIVASTFSDLVQNHQQLLFDVSVLIDTIGLTEQTQQIYEQVLEIAKERHIKHYPKLLYIFTSGIMTFGNASQTSVDENTRPQPTHEWIEKRRLFEWRLLNEEQQSLDTTVIRPGFVYGKNGGAILKDYFTSHNNQKDGKLVLIGSTEKRWSWVHIDDLGEGYEVRVKMAKIAGWKGEDSDIVLENVPQQDAGLVVFENTVIIDPRKAVQVLGWKPKHLSFLDNLEVYYHAWKAIQ